MISYFRYRFIAAYKYILFSSLLFVVVVHASCDKHRFTDAWRMCGTLHGGRSQLLFALQQSSIDRFVENSDFSLSHLHSTPPLGGGFPLEYCHDVWYGKSKMVWLPDSKIVWWYDYSFWQNSQTRHTDGETDGQLDTAWRHRPRLCITSRGKNGRAL